MRKKIRPPAVLGTARIEKFSHDGRGIARIEGKTTFIEQALPGETVTFQYTKQKRDFDEGFLVEVIEASQIGFNHDALIIFSVEVVPYNI